MNKQKNIFETFQSLKTPRVADKGIDLDLAQSLTYMKGSNNYKKILGRSDATWKEFVEMKELQPLSVPKAFRLVVIYKKFIVDLKLKREDIQGVDSRILQSLSSIVDSKNVKAWLDKARTLSRSGFYRELKYGNIDPHKCKHNFKNKTIKQCKKCGTKQEI